MQTHKKGYGIMNDKNAKKRNVSHQNHEHATFQSDIQCTKIHDINKIQVNNIVRKTLLTDVFMYSHVHY